jgi:hypothetical protein
MIKKWFISYAVFQIFFLNSANASRNEWEMTEYVWSLGITAFCNVGVDKDPVNFLRTEDFLDKSKYNNIKRGDIVGERPSCSSILYRSPS